jgi:hypothetical protein
MSFGTAYAHQHESGQAVKAVQLTEIISSRRSHVQHRHALATVVRLLQQPVSRVCRERGPNEQHLVCLFDELMSTGLVRWRDVLADLVGDRDICQ